jgi:hypothetical protein
MSKELDSLELICSIVETNQSEIAQLDSYSLALIGGGELVVAN